VRCDDLQTPDASRCPHIQHSQSDAGDIGKPRHWRSRCFVSAAVSIGKLTLIPCVRPGRGAAKPSFPLCRFETAFRMREFVHRLEGCPDCGLKESNGVDQVGETRPAGWRLVEEVAYSFGGGAYF
jgi:hypothetical protein